MKKKTALEVLRDCIQSRILDHLDATELHTLEQRVRRMPPETKCIPLEVLAAAPNTIWRNETGPVEETAAILTRLMDRLCVIAHGQFPATACEVDTAHEGEIRLRFTLDGRRYEHTIQCRFLHANSISHLRPVVELVNRALCEAGRDIRLEWLLFHEDMLDEAGPYREAGLFFLTYEQHGQVVLRDLVRLDEHYRYPLCMPRGFEDTTRELQALGLLDPRDVARIDEVYKEWGNEDPKSTLHFLLPAFEHSVCFFDSELIYEALPDYTDLIQQLIATSRGGFVPQDLSITAQPYEGGLYRTELFVSFSLGGTPYQFSFVPRNAYVNGDLFYELNRILAAQPVPGQFYDLEYVDQHVTAIYMTHEQHSAVVERALIPLEE